MPNILVSMFFGVDTSCCEGEISWSQKHPKAAFSLAPSPAIAKHNSFKGVLGLAQSCCEGARSFLADAALLFHGLGSKAAVTLGSKSFEARVTSVKVGVPGWGGCGRTNGFPGVFSPYIRST